MILSWPVLVYGLVAGFLMMRLRRQDVRAMEQRFLTGAGWVLMGASFSLSAMLLAVAVMLNLG